METVTQMKTKTIPVNNEYAPTWSWVQDREAVAVPELLTDKKPCVRGISEGVFYSPNPSDAEKCKITDGKNPFVYKKDGKKTAAGSRDVFSPLGEVSAAAALSEGVLVSVMENSHAAENCPVVLEYGLSDGEHVSTAQVVHAAENSSVKMVIVSSSGGNDGGFQSIRTEVYAARNAKVHLVKIQLLGNGFVQTDETAVFCGENARVEVTHIVLGGEKTYLGVGGSLSEYKASFRSDCAYLCEKNQLLDMQYVIEQRARKTDCQMFVNGTLRGNGRKNYCGIIDFKNGCSGSTGNEQEETLVLSPSAKNNSLPVILCDEEDVSGEHGATIGRLREDELFYMESRGIPKDAAENMIARAKIQSLLAAADDERTEKAAGDYMDILFGAEG